MNDEIQVQLRRYAESGADDAFAAVVQKCLPLVYGASFRRVAGDAHCAQDVTQLVFMALARNAAKLAKHPDLTGWLYTTTRFLAAKALRSERRRQAREQEVYMTQPSDDAPIANELSAVVDDVLMELKQLDRQLILLRFHRGMRLAEIGAQLEATENAVQKRLDRALEQLKEKLARRGVTSTAAALAFVLESQSVLAVPAGLAASVTTAGLAGGASIGGLLLAPGFMMVSKLKIGLVAAGLAVVGTAFVWETRENARLRAMIAEGSEAEARSLALSRQITTAAQHAESAEADARSLQGALQAAKAAQVVSPPRRELMDAQTQTKAAMARGNKLLQEGKKQEALDEYLASYRSLQGQRGGTVWQQVLLGRIKDLGRTYPQALVAMRELRDVAMQKLASNPDAKELVSEIGVLNERLGDTQASVALYESLPSGHPGRQALGMMAHKTFVETQRYADALVGKSPAMMMRELEMGMSSLIGAKSANLASHRSFVVNGALTNIEVLTGAGKLDDARLLTEKLLQFDGSEVTRAAIDRHVARANSRAIR